jgi:hypothetical protein
MITQGGESNLSGQFLESAIEQEFTRRGIPVFDWGGNGDNGDLLAPHFLLRNVPYTSIYGCQSRSEFVYRHFRGQMDVRFECRWQQVAGSVDEKLPYMLANARTAMPEQEVWLIIEGGGARSHALNWIRREAATVHEKTIRVLLLPEARQLIKQIAGRELVPA